ncbi:MAG: hypothetical protein PF482_01660 [Desulfobacteraceae bacterium]|nr:hypothetical protein [Desulfobacteraceae bacterium]
MPEKVVVNPSLTLVPVLWKNLAHLITANPISETRNPEAVPAHVIIWQHPKTGHLNIKGMDQILPLGNLLRGRTDHFTFNRLSTVGEGKQLLMPVCFFVAE